MKHKIAAFLLSVAAAALSATALFMPTQVSYADVPASTSDYPETEKPESGLYSDSNGSYFIGRDGEKVINKWVNVSGDWMFFGEDGYSFCNVKRRIDRDYYIFDDYGRLLSGAVAKKGGIFTEIVGDDAILDAEYYCGDDDSDWKKCKVTTEWYFYPDKLKNRRYDGFEEIWFFFEKSGEKVTGTRTINGREYDFDNNGVMLPGDVHIIYYPSADITDHYVSEFYNSGAADCVYQRPQPRFLKDFPETKYKFLGWVDEDGKMHQVGDKIEFMQANVYGVWEEIETKQQTSRRSSGGGNATSTNVTIVANGQSVTSSALAGITVGSDISGPYVSGRWKQDANGVWSFTDASGKNYADEWAYVYNPHSTTKEKAGWFSFDAAGNMRSGWFTDKDGRRYFLNDDPADPNFGLMQTGWVEIGGDWYYFNTEAKGTRGSLFVNTTTPDGWRVDANGRRIGRAS